MIRGKALMLTKVEVTGTEADGTEWRFVADEATIRLSRGGTFVARLRQVWPWGECHGQITRLRQGIE